MPFLPNQQLHPYQQQDYPTHLDLHFQVEQDIHQVEQDILQPDLGILLLVEGNPLVEMGTLLLAEMGNHLVGMDNLVLAEVGIHCSVSALQDVDILLLGVDIQDLVVGIPLSWVGVLHPVGDMAQMIVGILVQEGTGDKPEVGRVLGGSLSRQMMDMVRKLDMGKKHLAQVDLQDSLAWNQGGTLQEEQKIQKKDKTCLLLGWSPRTLLVTPLNLLACFPVLQVLLLT